MFRKSKSQVLPTSPIDYPAGTFIETEKGYFYILNSSKRYRLISKRVLDSWRPHRVVKTTEAAVRKYRTAAKMKFRNGSLIHSLEDGRIYLIVDTKKRPLLSPEAFEKIGANRNRKEVVTVSAEELGLHEIGDGIS